MKRKKYLSVIAVVLVLLFFAISASTALAGRSPQYPPPQEHPPVCYVVPHYVGGVYELACYDVGKDIINVGVKTNGKYELAWDNETVSLRVYYGREGDVEGFWFVSDKAGSEVSGTLP